MTYTAFVCNCGALLNRAMSACKFGRNLYQGKAGCPARVSTTASVLQVLLSSNQGCPHSLGTRTPGVPLKGPQQMAMASVCRGIDIFWSERFGVTQQALGKVHQGTRKRRKRTRRRRRDRGSDELFGVLFVFSAVTPARVVLMLC